MKKLSLNRENLATLTPEQGEQVVGMKRLTDTCAYTQCRLANCWYSEEEWVCTVWTWEPCTVTCITCFCRG